MPDPGLLKVRQVWLADFGEITFPIGMQAVGNTVAIASDNGQVGLLDVRTGESIWRAQVGASISAGVGYDGRSAALVTSENELVVLQEGRELWRQRLAAPSYTAPLVAGARVFVLGADRSVSAFDGQSGRRLWTQTRTGEALFFRDLSASMLIADRRLLLAEDAERPAVDGDALHVVQVQALAPEQHAGHGGAGERDVPARPCDLIAGQIRDRFQRGRIH